MYKDETADGDADYTAMHATALALADCCNGLVGAYTPRWESVLRRLTDARDHPETLVDCGGQLQRAIANAQDGLPALLTQSIHLHTRLIGTGLECATATDPFVALALALRQMQPVDTWTHKTLSRKQSDAHGILLSLAHICTYSLNLRDSIVVLTLPSTTAVEPKP